MACIILFTARLCKYVLNKGSCMSVFYRPKVHDKYSANPCLCTTQGRSQPSSVLLRA